VDWIEVLTPSMAVIAVFLAVGLIVQSIRHGRAIRRVEDRLAQVGAAAAETPLERLAQLQGRTTTSQGGIRPAGSRRTWAIAAAAVVALAVAGAGVWWFAVRDSGGTTAQAGGGNGGGAGGGDGTTTGTTSTTAPPDPGLCRNVPALTDNGLVLTTILNASGVSGAANNVVRPKISAAGYSIGVVGNPPDGRSDLRRTVVHYMTARDRPAACNVAKDLGLRPVRVSQAEGFSADQVGGDGVNVVVLVGTDLANG
jgi:hypothetical protein